MSEEDKTPSNSKPIRVSGDLKKVFSASKEKSDSSNDE